MEIHIFSKSPAIIEGDGSSKMTGGVLGGWGEGMDSWEIREGRYKERRQEAYMGNAHVQVRHTVLPSRPYQHSRLICYHVLPAAWQGGGVRGVATTGQARCL